MNCLNKYDDRQYFKILKDCFDDFNYLSFELNNFSGSDQILVKFKFLHAKFNKQNREETKERIKEK